METVPTCSGILSDGQPGPLLAQGEDVAAAGAENAVHGGTVARKTRRRDECLDGAGKAAPCIRQAPPLPSRMCWLRASATERLWWRGSAPL